MQDSAVARVSFFALHNSNKASAALCKAKKLTLATAESCTGGLVAATLSEIPGSSLVLDRGFVTDPNDAKQQMLGVTPATIDVYGAVSTECAEEMAKGALAHASVDLALRLLVRRRR